MMIILRITEGKKFKYVVEDQSGPVTSKMMDYIKSLVIPPAYSDVRIFYPGNGVKQPKLLYMGIDSKKRTQRIYSAEWRKSQDKLKFCNLINFSDKIGEIVEDSEKVLKTPFMSPTRVRILALIIKLIMTCHFRIGNDKYKELYGSYGAINILKKHITIKKDKMIIKFIGKKSVINSCVICEKSLIDAIEYLIKDKEPNQPVFQYPSTNPEDKGKMLTITAIEFNKHLNEYDPLLTSKMFRTWDSNMLFILYMQNHDPTKIKESERKKILNSAYKFVSDKINNTPAILKKSYTQSGLSDMYLKTPNKYKNMFMFGDPKELFTNYLKSIC